METDTDSHFEGENVVLPDDYVGAWFTAKELRKKNKELAKHGRRICIKHQGAALPLDAEHFRYADKEHRWYRHECVVCENKRKNDRMRERYQTDHAYREQRKEWRRKHRVEHPEAYQDALKYTQAWKRRKLAARYPQLFGRSA